VKQLQGDTPQHKVVVQSLLVLPRGFDLDLTYRYVSAIPDQGVDAYSTGDARLAKRIARSIELSAVGQNLFQPHHPEYGLVGVRRSAFLRLEWSAGR
jgi:iron complex outermembrane receptor protein